MNDRATQVVIVVRTRNAKLRKKGQATVYATTVPVVQTCPKSCPLLDHGCYGQRKPGGHVARLERNAKRRGLTTLDLARDEAEQISRVATTLRTDAPLRLHVSGDCRSTASAKIVSAACATWRGPIWTFTHAWREVARHAWAPISVLASLERSVDALVTLAQGYAPALLVSKHPEDGRAWFDQTGVRFIPCPNETRGITCVECRLCFDADALLRRATGISFAPHGSGKRRVTAVLVQLRRAPRRPGV